MKCTYCGSVVRSTKCRTCGAPAPAGKPVTILTGWNPSPPVRGVSAQVQVFRDRRAARKLAR
jgi:hypothetical protein